MSIRVLDLQKIVFTVVLLAMSTTLIAQQTSAGHEKQPQQHSEKEQTMMQRLYEAQMNGSDSDFYEAHESFMNYLKQNQNWGTYYRTWMNRVIYDVNHK